MDKSTYRRYSVVPKCGAGGRSLYDYSTMKRADDDGRVECPECGKVVQLQRQFAWRMRTRIPQHNVKREVTA